MSGIELIAEERRRQIEAEGWTPEHDDQHDDEELALAAACYAMPPEERGSKIVPHHSELSNNARYTDDSEPFPVGAVEVPALWPWEGCWWKPSTRERDLVKAGALNAAAIDRRLRSAGK